MLFVDAAHFIYSAYAGFLWCFQRVFLASPSGRKRFNVLGGIDAVTKELVMVSNDSYINAKSVCSLLKKIYLKYLPSGLVITLVLDNARYQKCKLVRRYARCLNIELLYMPSYSPQLNLIERLWKFVKKQTLYAKYYPNFDEFKFAIQDCLDKTNTSFKSKLDTLLSWNFQSFENVKKLTV